MLTPGVYTMTAQRWQPFKLTAQFPGYDFTGAKFAMQIRASRDRTDAPLIDASAGITATTTATSGVPASILTVQISEAAIEGLVFSNPAGGDLSLFYDLVITPSGGVKTRFLEGPFIVHAGVTHD